MSSVSSIAKIAKTKVFVVLHLLALTRIYKYEGQVSNFCLCIETKKKSLLLYLEKLVITLHRLFIKIIY